MSGDGSEDVTIPAVFMQKEHSNTLRELLQYEDSVYVLLTWLPQEEEREEERKEERKEDKPDIPVSKMESKSVESGLYDSGSGSDDQQTESKHTRTCSSEECDSSNGFP